MLENDLPEIVKTFPEPERLPFDIAMLIDNVVYQVLNVDGQSAAQYLSQPTYIRVKNEETRVGWKYNPETKTFSRPTYDPDTDTYYY